MFTKKQVAEIKEHLAAAQNPLIYYDNDPDGLCSYLILRRYLGRGKGVAIKSYPDLNAQYAKKVQELQADYVFILDKPVIAQEFLEELDKFQVPIVIIDHHDLDNEYMHKHSNVSVYNPTKNKGKDKSSEPVTALIFSVTQRAQDIWLALMGCIADHYLPPFSKEFEEHYPQYWGKVKEPFDAYYRTEIGKLAQAVSFGLKDSISHVIALQKFLIDCSGPQDILAELESNALFRKRYEEIKKKYALLLAEAKEQPADKLIFFSYSGDLSISAELANELSYYNQKKYIAVAYIKGNIANISLRGKNVKAKLESVLKKLEHASGGGHTDAVGARIQATDIEKFKDELMHEISS